MKKERKVRIIVALTSIVMLVIQVPIPVVIGISMILLYTLRQKTI